MIFLKNACKVNRFLFLLVADSFYESQSRNCIHVSKQHSVYASGGLRNTGTLLYAVEIYFRRNPKKSLLWCKAGEAFLFLGFMVILKTIKETSMNLNGAYCSIFRICGSRNRLRNSRRSQSSHLRCVIRK